MDFTPLHRALGVEPCPLSDELLDDAVAARVAETADLDWKSRLPRTRGLTETDFPKDVAAMANSGGGLIVYGVEERQRSAVRRVDVGDLDEANERSLRQAAYSAISPPVLNLLVHRIGTEPNRAVVLEVPASSASPHLIFKNECFAAPMRNGADTFWMNESQIAAMYRGRFEESRRATEALGALFDDALDGRNTERQAWFIGVARPRIPRLIGALNQNQAQRVFCGASAMAPTFTCDVDSRPLVHVDCLNPRPGLRRWVAPSAAKDLVQRYFETWASVHHDGSVSLATIVGQPFAPGGSDSDPWRARSSAIEIAVADLMALIRSNAMTTINDEYDLRVGISWGGRGPLYFETMDSIGQPTIAGSIPMHRYSPVDTTVNARVSDTDYGRSVYLLAQDCVNQGGVSELRKIIKHGT